MARDYKNTRRPPDDRALPPWAWLVTGLALGMAIAAGIYLVHSRNQRLADEQPAQPRPRAAEEQASGPAAGESADPAGDGAGSATAGESTGQGSRKPRFDFYELLPNFELAIPERRGTGGESGPDRPETPLEPGRYVLQAGAFRSHADADRRKAKLALLGIESSIQKVTVDSADGGTRTWHRVRVGPISDLDRLERTRARLDEEGIDTLLLRVQG